MKDSKSAKEHPISKAYVWGRARGRNLFVEVQKSFEQQIKKSESWIEGFSSEDRQDYINGIRHMLAAEGYVGDMEFTSGQYGWELALEGQQFVLTLQTAYQTYGDRKSDEEILDIAVRVAERMAAEAGQDKAGRLN
ncbi:MAG: hypothetical protein H6922_00340 [Pseudomonadaceae bacterium]|nr:hypothetical protein [Pseudomonadaceae bacterium]